MTALDLITEKQWQHQVIQLARLHHWTHYHTYRSIKSPSGFPDLVLARERLLFIELKTEKGKLTPAQKEWLRVLRKAGQEVYVARPRHLEQLQLVLANRTGIEVIYDQLILRDHLDELLAA